MQTSAAAQHPIGPHEFGRFSNGAPDRPTQQDDPFIKSQIWQPHPSTYFSQMETLAPKVNNDIVAFVRTLHESRGPRAIAGFVVPVIVQPLQGMKNRRPWTHVGEKRSEGKAPSKTNADASGAVILERGISGVMTSQPGLAPGSVFWRARAAMVFRHEDTDPVLDHG